MAAGVTGSPVPITGDYGQPLTIRTFFPDYYGGPNYIDLTSPIPVQILTSSDSSSTLSATDYTGTVDWGDGSAPVPASFERLLSPTSMVILPDNSLYVSGPGHTYATPGTYTITVSVAGPGDAAPATFADTATISAAPALTGALDQVTPLRSVITSVASASNTPAFHGTAQPGTTIGLAATNLATGQTLLVGAGVADASGDWIVTSAPLVDGSYTFAITATSAYGGTATLQLAANDSSPAPVTVAVDTSGPTITAFRVTNARTGAFAVTYSDPEGVAAFLTTNPAAYTVNRPSPAPKKGQRFAVASLMSSIPSNTTSAPVVTVTGTLTGGKGKPPIARNGTYTFAINSASILSSSGVALDGEYSGRFPTGDGQPGGDFRVKVVVRNGKAGAAMPIAPAKVAAKAIVRPKAHA